MGRLKRMLAALVVLAVMAGTVFLLTRVLQPGYTELRTYTDDASGLPEGSVVRLNGITIGELDRVLLTGSTDPNRKVEFVMKVKSRYLSEIPDDSTVGVASTNLLGGNYLNIVRGRSSKTVQAGGELVSLVAVDPQKLLAQMSNEFQQIDAIVARANQLLNDVSEGQGNIGKWSKEGMNSFNAVSREYARLMNDVQNGHGNLARFLDLMTQVQATPKRLDDVMAGSQSRQGTAGRYPGFTKELDGLTKDVQQLTDSLNAKTGPSARITDLEQRYNELMTRVQATIDRMNSGQGTVGRLMVNSQFSAALTNTSSEFQALARDIRANPRKFLSLRVRLF